VTARVRLGVFAAVALIAFLGAGGYVAYAFHQREVAHEAAPGVSTRTDVATVVGGPHLAFRSTALGDGYGQTAMVPLTAPDGPRVLIPASCERLYAATTEMICLSADRGLVTTYRAIMLTADFSARNDLPLVGLPSRARLSPDGTWAATTTFVYGDSYNSPGRFSTRTLITRVDGSASVDLEQFQLIVGDRTVNAVDRNLWGVTFANDDLFYATAASGGKTWLVRGSVAARRLTALREDVECPSLSPDRTRIAFKRHGDLPAGKWRLAIYDLATGKETLLAEERSVDDQAEWLDDAHVLYGLPRAGEGTASSDIWSVPADGTGAPRILVHNAWSPAVVR